MKYYHATLEHNALSIMEEGKIHCGCDRVVYLADSAANAVKFVALRTLGQPVVVFELDELDESKIAESFDHNASFFPMSSVHLFRRN